MKVGHVKYESPHATCIIYGFLAVRGRTVIHKGQQQVRRLLLEDNILLQIGEEKSLRRQQMGSAQGQIPAFFSCLSNMHLNS